MLYAIGDLHLSLGTNKPMDVFGEKWEDYTNKLIDGFSLLNDEDVCVICGDVSWGMSLSESKADFQFINSLPGRKIILKGNHDYWWSTKRKMQQFFADEGINSINILHNNCFFYKDTAICGTRGWFYEEERYGEHDQKIMNRELIRLEASLQAAGEKKEKICFLHYPPRYGDYVCQEIVALFKKYGVKQCCYGHIHGKGQKRAIRGVVDGVEYHMISADFLKFIPKKMILL